MDTPASSFSPLPPGFTLPFQPINLRRRYGLIFYVCQGGKEQKIHYELDVSCDAATPTGDFRFRIDRKQVYINDKAPDTLLDGMADHCGKVLYPLLAGVNRRGQFIGVENGAEIRKRWQDARPALARYYTGKIAEDILTGMDTAVVNDRYISEALRRDWLFTLLFTPLYHIYQDYEATADMHVPLIPYRLPLRYTFRLKAAPRHTENGFISIAVTGACTDARNPEDILKGNLIPISQHVSGIHTSSNGKAMLTYEVYPQNGTIFSVTGTCSLCLPGSEEKTISVEMYQLGKRDLIPNSREETSIIPENKPAPVKKKTNWYFFPE